MSGSSPSSPKLEGEQGIGNLERTPTDSSYFSCSGLPENDPARYLNAAHVRAQVQAAPNKRERVQAVTPGARPHLAKYPTTFKNTEQLTLQSKTPRQEYPVLQSGSWDKDKPDTAGKARVVYNKSDRTTSDVVYHDPNAGGDTSRNHQLANYRAAATSSSQSGDLRSK